MRQRIGAVLAALIVFGLFITPVQAGGWAVVTLDKLPEEIRAAKTLELGFMVRQHGVTPIDTAFDSTTPMIPFLTATNLTTGEKLRAEAVKNGVKGHFSVTVTFPSSGEWQWQITPPPFAGTELGRVQVLPAVAAPVAEANKAADYTPLLRWGGLGILTLAFVLALASRFAVIKRGRVVSSR